MDSESRPILHHSSCQLGDGLSVSAYNTADSQGMAGFPNVATGDDVVAQHKLLARRFLEA